MRAYSRYLSCLFAIVLVAGLWGCSGDDENNPTNPGGTRFSDDPAVQAQIDKGLEVGNAMMAMAPRWAAGDFVGPPNKDAIFDEGCMCWIWSEDLGNPYSNPWDYTSWQFTATFYAGETPVADPETADRLMVQVTYIQDSGFHPGEGKDADSESNSFVAQFTVVISPLNGGPVTVSGGGTAEFTSVGTVNGTFFEFYEEFNVHMELALPGSGCPSGIMTLETMDEQDGPTLLSVSYDGTATAYWTLSQGWQGENTIRGSAGVVCGGD